MKIIDTHAHVLKSSYKDELPKVIEEMKERNIEAYNISYDLISSMETLKMYEEHKFLLPVIGIHPCDTQEYKKHGYVEKLEKLITDDVVAIGEIGLDYFHKPFDAEEQKEAFIEQIELARKYDLPIVVHTRDSLDDCYEIIKNYPEQKFLLHSWSGCVDLTKKYMEISDNIYFSYNGILTFKNAEMQREVIKTIPLNRIMFETDCPYLSPSPERGTKNYPWKTKMTIEFAAELLGMSFEELNESNTKVAKDFYKK